jgi:hypothetical protein
MRTVLLATLFTLGCGSSSGEEAYDTLQDCFDDHHGAEGYDVMQSISICTLDHKIGGAKLDFATLAECTTYVDANLTDTSATVAEIAAGCQDYLDQKGR